MSESVVQSMPIEKEFEEMFKEQFSSIYNYICYHVGNVEDAEDLTADVFVRAYEYWGSYCSSKGSRGAWLGGIARNLVKTYYQKKSNRPQISHLSELVVADVYIEDDYLRKEELTQIFEQMDELPERQRELLNMKYLLRLNNREISKLTGLSESNVGVMLYRTIKKIQKNLKKRVLS